MSLQTALADFLTAGFPDRSLTDPAKKTSAWIRQMAAAGVSEFLRAQSSWQLWAHDPNVAENIRYAEGEQDTQQYRRFAGASPLLDGSSLEASNRDGYLDERGGPVYDHGSRNGATDPLGLDSIVKAQPLPVLPVKLQALKALIIQRYETSITALGEKAGEERHNHEKEVQLWMDQGPAYAARGQAPPPGLPDPLPQTDAELQTYLTTWQVGAAADLELKIQITDVESDMDQLMDEVATDLLVHGYGGLWDYYRAGQRTVAKRILPGKGLFMPSAYPDYRDAEMGGVLETVYLETLLAEASNNRRTCNGQGKTWNKDDIARLRELAAQSLPKNLQTDPVLGETANTGGLQVVRWFFRTDDEWAQESYVDAQGVLHLRKAKAGQGPGQPGGEVTRLAYNCLYEATLVCGTDLAYNCRKVEDQGRDLHNPLKARLPFALFSAGVTGGRPTSLVRRVKGIVDEMERSWRGYMADMRTYVPEGYNVSMKALQAMVENMKFAGEDGVMQAYRFFRQQGDTFSDPVDENGSPVGAAVQKNPTGLPESAERHLNHLLQQLQLLESLTGANAVVSAATPNSESGKGVNQLALQGAANVMQFARTGLKKIYEGHARNLAGRIAATDAHIPVTGSVPGPLGGLREVGPRQDFHDYRFHMRVELGPSDEEWQQLYQKAALAASGPASQAQITVADEMYIHWLRNLKTAQRYLAMAVRRKAREDEQRALGLQKANGDVQTQTAQAAAQAQQQTDAARHQQEMERLTFQRDTAWGTVDRQVAAQRDIAGLSATTKREVAETEQIGQAHREAAADTRAHENSHVAAVRDMLLAPQPEPVTQAA